MSAPTNTITFSKQQAKAFYHTLKDLATSYQEKDPDTSDRAWLTGQYQQFLPQLSEKEADSLSAATLNGIHRFDSVLKEVSDWTASGKSKEQWFAEKMGTTLEDMEISEAGDCVQALDSALFYGNYHMAENNPVVADEEKLTVQMPEPPELEEDSKESHWNPFMVKELLTHLGQGAALTGIQTFNQSQVLDFAAESVVSDLDDASNLRDLIESGNTEQIKALLTAALKIGSTTHKLPFLSSAASVDTLAGIASHGVEYASTLSRFSAGKITLIQAMEHVGLSGVSLLYNLCSVEGIRNISTALLSQIPIVGPVLGTVVGGLISVTLGKNIHEKVRSAVKKVENTVRSAVNTAWTKVKSFGQKVKSKVKSFFQRLFA